MFPSLKICPQCQEKQRYIKYLERKIREQERMLRVDNNIIRIMRQKIPS